VEKGYELSIDSRSHDYPMRQTQLPASQVIVVTIMQGIDDKSAEQMMFMD
jgi:hypothetical protein